MQLNRFDTVCRKKAIPFFCILTALLLSGCAKADEYVLRAANVTADADYISYEEMEDRLDEDGQYPLENDMTEDIGGGYCPYNLCS